MGTRTEIFRRVKITRDVCCRRSRCLWGFVCNPRVGDSMSKGELSSILRRETALFYLKTTRKIHTDTVENFIWYILGHKETQTSHLDVHFLTQDVHGLGRSNVFKWEMKFCPLNPETVLSSACQYPGLTLVYIYKLKEDNFRLTWVSGRVSFYVLLHSSRDLNNEEPAIVSSSRLVTETPDYGVLSGPKHEYTIHWELGSKLRVHEVRGFGTFSLYSYRGLSSQPTFRPSEYTSSTYSES